MKKFVLCCSLLLAASIFSADTVTIVENGKNPAAIVLPAKPSRVESFAAQELAECLQLAAKTRFKIYKQGGKIPAGTQIILGRQPELPQLPEGKFLIKTRGQKLYLYGGGFRGTLSAVHRFLEDGAGLRFLDAWGSIHVPANGRTIKTAIDKVYSEGLPFRSLMTVCYTNQPIADRFLIRRGQNLLNHSRQFSFLNKAGNEGKGNHSLHKFIPPQKYFKTNPEFFTMDKKGKRVPGSQLCFASKGLRKEMTKNVISHCKSSALKKISKDHSVWIEVSAMDAPGKFCFCSGCKALEEKYRTPCGAFFEYLAELSLEVKKEIPGAMVATLLYRKEQTEKPPANLKMPENFLGIFAPVDANFFAPMDHSSSTDTLKNLRAWCKTASNVWVWYYPDSYGIGNMPFSGLRRSIRDLQLMIDAGITGTFFEHDVTPINSLNFSELESYCFLKMFAGDKTDPEQMIKEFITLYYGKAAPMVEKYFNELENYLKKGAEKGIAGFYACNPIQLGYINKSNLKRWSDDFDKMEQLVKNDPAVLFRIKALRRAVDQTRLELMLAPAKEWKQLAERCTATLKRLAKERRFASKSNDNIIANLQNIAAMTHPAGFENVKIENIRRLRYNGSRVLKHTGRVSFPYGMYCQDYRSKAAGDGTIKPTYTLLARRMLSASDVKPDTFAWYKIGNITLTDAARVMTTPAGYFFVDIGRFYVEPGTKWDVYYSLKFEGPAVPGSKAAKNLVSCNEILLVKTDSK